jgi:hypothetical protein
MCKLREQLNTVSEPRKLITGLINEASLNYTDMSFVSCFDFTLLVVPLMTGADVGLLKDFFHQRLNRDMNVLYSIYRSFC